MDTTDGRAVQAMAHIPLHKHLLVLIRPLQLRLVLLFKSLKVLTYPKAVLMSYRGQAQHKARLVLVALVQAE
jgi:hypothetical protein